MRRTTRHRCCFCLIVSTGLAAWFLFFVNDGEHNLAYYIEDGYYFSEQATGDRWAAIKGDDINYPEVGDDELEDDVDDEVEPPETQHSYQEEGAADEPYEVVGGDTEEEVEDRKHGKKKKHHPKVDDDDLTTVGVTVSTTVSVSTTPMTPTSHKHGHGHAHHGHVHKVEGDEEVVSEPEMNTEELLEKEDITEEQAEVVVPSEVEAVAQEEEVPAAQVVPVEQEPQEQVPAVQPPVVELPPLLQVLPPDDLPPQVELTPEQPAPIPEQPEEVDQPHGHITHHKMKTHHGHHQRSHDSAVNTETQVDWTPEELLAKQKDEEDAEPLRELIASSQAADNSTKMALTNVTMPTHEELHALMMQQLPEAPITKTDRVNWEKFFSFIPNGLQSCIDLFPNLATHNPLPQDFQQTYIEFGQTIRQLNINDSNISEHLEQFIVYYFLVRAPFVKTVCETGFGAGHSTFLWLQANPDVTVYSFDLGLKEHSAPIAGYLAARFPGRLNVIWGDSVNTLPMFRQKNKDVTCDIVVIDGGHTFRESFADYFHFRQMVTKNNIVLLDNYPDITKDYMDVLGSVWEGGKRRGEINEIFHCDYRPRPHGFSVGRYTPWAATDINDVPSLTAGVSTNT